jgi:GrpB-like predicted nucleotidyltransferase (UPF0157 family)/GNAT superfamily N-acetyltransferase
VKFYDYETYIERLVPIYQELFESVSNLVPQARIEHVGASSVNGCISKGDLDILVAVDKESFQVALEKIKSLEFYEKKDTLRTDELCMLITDKYEGEDVAIQLIVRGSEFEKFLRLRDILRSCPDILEQYNNLKRISESLDETEYREKKSRFVSSILSLNTYPNILAKKVLNISEDIINPERNYDDACCALWINQPQNNQGSKRLKLISVSDNNLWNEMFKIRKNIEYTEYGLEDDKEVQKMIEKIKRYSSKFNGEWFLAQLGEEYIGEIGIIPIKLDDNIYGRLRDVDILKSFRGHGYANDLLKEIMYLSNSNGMKGLGVRAKNQSWIKQWYERLGFIPIETWK